MQCNIPHVGWQRPRCNSCPDLGVWRKGKKGSGPGHFRREFIFRKQRENKINTWRRIEGSSDEASTVAVPEDSASQQLSGSRSPSASSTPRGDAGGRVADKAALPSVPESANAQPQIPALLTDDVRPTMRMPGPPERITRAIASINALPANVLFPDCTCADGNDDVNFKHGSMRPNLLQDSLVEFLASGGDDRIQLDSRGCNKYNTTALPQPRGIHRSSCTSNCCTDYSFNKGERLVASLVDEAQNTSDDGGRKYMQHITDIRCSIRKVWKLPDDESCGITLCPSGSDAEYLPLLLALVRMLAMPESDRGNGILSVVCAAGEVGSGTLSAATGRHFSDLSPKPGYRVKNGDAVFSLPESFPPVEAMEVLVRNKAGQVKCHDEVDDEVRDIVETALTEQNFRVVLVHMVAGSKTGHLVPSLCVLEELSQKWGKAIVPIVDACQGRLQEGALKQLLLRDMLVLVTGSKFYGGPPFSGMVLLPGGVSREIDSSPSLHKHFRGRPFLGDLPLFMDDLCLSENLPNLRQIIAERHGGKRPYNWGIVVRWALALNEITLFHRIPEPIRDSILCKWTNSTRQLVADLGSPLLQCVETERDLGGASAESQVGMFAINTIVSLICRVQDGNPYKRLGLAELKRVHVLMGEDLSGVALAVPNVRMEATLPGPYGTHQVNTTRDVLATRCFIAQPVQLQPGFKFGLTVLRIAIGAPLVSWIFDKSQRLSMLDSSGIDKVVNLAAQSDFVLLQKLLMILEHWRELKDYKPSQN